MNYIELYKMWSESGDIDIILKEELKKCNYSEIEDRFYRDLEFGTGGLRGVIAAGTNRMNIYTVAKVSYGFTDYLNNEFDNPACAIAFDSRKFSKLFAETAAVILAKSDVKVYIFRELMPTPMLSYAVRELKCSGGIVITASHNPAIYNGYKVYGTDGCQITPDAADKITSQINKHDIKFETYAEFDLFVKLGKINYIDKDIINKYYNLVLAQINKMTDIPLKVVYSPFNGAGNKHIQQILSNFPNIEVITVPEQEQPDENFTTCPYPNPEIKEAMYYVDKLAAETGADIGLATDPDCDRVGVLLPEQKGCVQINGNEMGILLLDYICKRRISLRTMPQNPIAIKTIVTSDMANSVAAEYGVKLINVLTGFKFIGEQIGLLEKTSEENRFIFGFEESYGYLCGSYVRDKDAVSTVMLICEMTAYYKNLGMKLTQVLDGLYKKYGFYKNELLNFAFEGSDGMIKMYSFLAALRKNTPSSFADTEVLSITDYENDNTGLPKSNVLLYKLWDGTKIVMRPSGTEPKLKIYIESKANDIKAAEKSLQKMRSFFTDMISLK
ncbi:MAG: phospho-sugar mutase [Eubacteriales bacterium]